MRENGQNGPWPILFGQRRGQYHYIMGNARASSNRAAEFGHAAALYLQTRRPQFVAGRSSSQRWGVQYGASHALQLSGLYALRLAPSVSATINVGLLNADGKYRFRYRRLTPRGVSLTTRRPRATMATFWPCAAN